jgi:hypothetical protein
VTDASDTRAGRGRPRPRTHPDVLRRAVRSPRVRGDIAVLAAIALFGWLALQLHDSVSDMGDMARGIHDTGTAIQASGRATATQIRGSIGDAADAVEPVPLFGADVAQRVRRAGRQSADAVERETRADGTRLVDAGRQGQDDARRTARTLGWLAFVVPTVLLLAIWLPRRRTL